jgi:hypothetical protein
VSTRSEVLLWAQRVIARKGQPAHVLLELKADATAEQAQAAFHKIARASHPDLHRHGLNPEEIDTVTSAYAAVAGAYQELRTRTAATTRIKPIGRDVANTPSGGAPADAAAAQRPMSGQSPASQRPSAVTPPAGTSTAATSGGAGAAQSMSSKALIYYRKAEIALNKGDLKAAILQLKLAVATDPSSTFLRSALAEVETEVRKTT